MAHLPTENTTLNLYHNPMGAFDDLEIQFMCAKNYNDGTDEPETVKFFLSCNDTSNKDNQFPFGCNYKNIDMIKHAWTETS